MRAFKQVKMRVKTINWSIFTEPVFDGNAPDSRLLALRPFVRPGHRDYKCGLAHESPTSSFVRPGHTGWHLIDIQRPFKNNPLISKGNIPDVILSLDKAIPLRTFDRSITKTFIIPVCYQSHIFQQSLTCLPAIFLGHLL
ncbi:hypothetical protein IFJ82_10885 [Novacetimonas hansenii]|uniref:Uncharacterized protein n=1 Tax=Novacetimonas hansenii TaxID=436 RepID=A0AAW5EVP9_NOVHA|nr:hypothetical protein [Novacetimonas hansenii]MCJ8355365.1 hypothetical protein [Novacetimonas hansenii]QOF94430.1 hypothetical protein IFJ82_10885 [Novacetimonas hansenii]